VTGHGADVQVRPTSDRAIRSGDVFCIEASLSYESTFNHTGDGPLNFPCVTPKDYWKRKTYYS